MARILTLKDFPDGGEFADGNGAALAWDVLHRVGEQDVPDVIDFADCPHLKPYSIACLCALGELGKLRGTPVEARPPKDPSFRQHLSRMGVANFLPGDWGFEVERATNIVVKRVQWPVGTEGERIVELLAARNALPGNVFPRMVECLEEIIDNALTHAESPIDCIVAGQAFPATQKVEVAIVDLGQTIRGHLCKNPKYRNVGDDETALGMALSDGITGTPDGQRNRRNGLNSGAGLFFVRDYCQSGAGQLTVLSGDRWMTCHVGGAPVIGHFRGGFKGCLVNIRYFTDQCLPSSKTEPIL